MTTVYKDIIELTVDLKTGVEEAILPIKQCDNLSRVLRCRLKNNNKLINLEGSQLILYVVKADQTLVMINGVINDKKVGTVDFELTEQALALVDEIQCEIVKIDSGNVKLSFPVFKVNIEDSIYDENLVQSQHEFSALTALISNVTGWENKFTTLYKKLDEKVDTEIAKTNAQLLQKASEQALAVERARIDSFAKLAEGSTTGDAELIDARIGAEGIVYPNTGEAIRKQISTVNSILIDNNFIKTILLNNSNPGFISSASKIEPHNDFNYSNPIELKSGETIQFIATGYNQNVAMISLKVSENSYRALVTSIDSNENMYTYTAKGDQTVVLSYNNKTNYNAKIACKISNQLFQLINDLDNHTLKSSYQQSIDFSNPSHFYISPNNGGSKYESEGFYTTKPFAIKSGDKIELTVSAYLDKVSVLSKLNDDGSYTSIITSTSSDLTTYTYQATEDFTGVISFFKNELNHAEILNNVSTTIILDRMESISNDVTEVHKKIAELTNKYKSMPGYIQMFHHIGIVGDSLSSGELAYSDDSGNHYVDKYNYSWLSNMCRRNGLSATHYSQGGMSCQSWLNNTGNHKSKLLSDSAKNAYFIALGTNDIHKSYEIGSISDTVDTPTFSGYYKQIIELIRNHAPNSVIFLMSLYGDWNEDREYSSLISDIANLYDNCFYVDFINNTDVYTGTTGDLASLNHFTTQGYIVVSEKIETLINKIVFDNMSYFKFFALNN